eukprot:3029785-Alexandrium_andersonii.AAC.1
MALRPHQPRVPDAGRRRRVLHRDARGRPGCPRAVSSALQPVLPRLCLRAVPDAAAGSAEVALLARLLACRPWTVAPDARRDASGEGV